MGRGGDGVTGVVAWFTGLPSSGKSTLAAAVATELRALGVSAVILDSDDLRAALVPTPSYDDASRAALYATLANLAALLAGQGHAVLVPATAHRRQFRADARERAPQFLEIFVDTPLEEAKRRDTKGLYASGGEQVPGIGVAYEPPAAPDVRVGPNDDTAAAQIAQRIVDLVR
jgi:adenylylsulfate kinase